VNAKTQLSLPVVLIRSTPALIPDVTVAPFRRWLLALAALGCLLFGAVSVQAAEEAASSKSFNHMSTGFALRGAHERLNCESCHVRGIFKGTPTRCSGCHLRSTDMEASKKSPNHIPTTEECDVCHNDFLPNVSWQLVRMNHVGIVNNCVQCHNGTFAPGKDPNHIPTQQPCELCHRSTVSFAGGQMDHTGIVASCSRCHNGNLATGKSGNHVPTFQPCEICHFSTTSFAGATMNHQGISTGCARCHVQGVATAKPPNHIPTTQPCEQCHRSFATFAGATMDHTGIISNCASCHEAGNLYGITGRPAPPHPPKSVGDCSQCHLNTRSWLPAFSP